MHCCQCDPVVPPSREGTRLSSLLRIMTFGHLILALLYLFILETTFIFNQLFCALIAYWSYRTYSYFRAAIYLWILIFSSITFFGIFGLYVQFNSYYLINSDYYYYQVVLYAISLAFCCLAIYIGYMSYREFKALAIETTTSPDPHVCKV